MENLETVTNIKESKEIDCLYSSEHKNKMKLRSKKRKRIDSDSSSETEDVLPENALVVENNLIASAVKNNLDDVCVKKILKKVVTNDHVLALVKLREEEENSSRENSGVRPKLTRAKAKKLKKPWNLENLELTPIKHIPVKTRPEVKALIAQELPEDEDDEEYEPTPDDIPSDDDQGLESCSDIDSQPRTPATPRSLSKSSPNVVKDGPFKVPPDISTPARRKINLDEEEATIALRTRSKLCLSETPIEHIENSFVPPDDLPVPPVDDHLWNEFLTECLNPASVTKHEDDDEADPEYNVAADPDAQDEDEEALDNSIIKISKKELNDLVTELFNIMPEATVDDELENIATSVLSDNTQNGTSDCWKGKKEPLSDEESSLKICEDLSAERRSSFNKFSIGKTEPVEDPLATPEGRESEEQSETRHQLEKESNDENSQPLLVGTPVTVVQMNLEEKAMGVQPPPGVAPLPPLVLRIQHVPHTLTIKLPNEPVILPDQLLILQQQLRQHIQICTSNFMQLFVNPLHWASAPTYREYLETFIKMVAANPSSVTNVCNLKPAMELVTKWEEAVSKDTPQNVALVEFISKQAERWRRASMHNKLYVGEFHETFKKVVANSSVFLYPYLLPPIPYGPDTKKKYSYLRAEDELIALGLDQFWQYVDSNPSIFRKPARSHPRYRWGLAITAELVSKHMFPWLTPRMVMQRINTVRSRADPDNPIYKFLTTNTVPLTKHKLIPFNPKITLYEQPEHEMPKCWLRYLANTSKRFKIFYRRRKVTSYVPEGVDIDVKAPAEPPPKTPLCIDFTKEIRTARCQLLTASKPATADKFDVEIQKETPLREPPLNFFQLVQTSTGTTFVPLLLKTDSDTSKVTLVPKPITINRKAAEHTNTVTCNDTPISSAVEATANHKQAFKTLAKTTDVADTAYHCCCCIILRQICKTKQTVITDFFRTKNNDSSKSMSSDDCRCNISRYPRVTKKLKLLIKRYKLNYKHIYEKIQAKLKVKKTRDNENLEKEEFYSLEELAYVAEFQQKLTIRAQIAKNIQIKARAHNLFSSFDIYWDDPIKLALELDQSFNVEMADVFKEFVGFLNPEQADQIGRFRDYFIHNCAGELLKKIEEHVRDEETKESLLKQISAFFSARDWNPCSMCLGLLLLMRPYPQLAEYTFALFPHARRQAGYNNVKTAPFIIGTNNTAGKDSQLTLDEAKSGEIYETGNFSGDDSEEDNSNTSLTVDSAAVPDYENEEAMTIVKTETIMSDEVFSQEKKTIAEMEHNISYTSTGNETNEVLVKSEPSEWKREEDKLILEMLKEHLTPAEMKDKTILELIEEKQIIQILMDSLTEKSPEEIKQRMLIILKLVVSGKL